MLWKGTTCDGNRARRRLQRFVAADAVRNLSNLAQMRWTAVDDFRYAQERRAPCGVHMALWHIEHCTFCPQVGKDQ